MSIRLFPETTFNTFCVGVLQLPTAGFTGGYSFWSLSGFLKMITLLRRGKLSVLLNKLPRLLSWGFALHGPGFMKMPLKCGCLGWSRPYNIFFHDLKAVAIFRKFIPFVVWQTFTTKCMDVPNFALWLKYTASTIAIPCKKLWSGYRQGG